MICQLFLKPEMLARIIKMRILAAFQPFDETVPLNREMCYLDGMRILTFSFDTSARASAFELKTNTQLDRTVKSTGRTFQFNPLRATVNAQLLFVSEQTVHTAAIPDTDGRYTPPPQIVQELAGLELDLQLDVSDVGVPSLNVQLGKEPLGSENVPFARLFLSKLVGMSVDLAMASAFADALDPGFDRTLNAGITFAGNDLVMRFEFEPEAQGVPDEVRRISAWQAFFAGGVHSPLGNADWAIDLPTNNIIASAARDLDKGMSSPAVQNVFSSGNRAWGTWHHGQPSFELHKRGVLEGACGGLDPKGELVAYISLSVPMPGTMRKSVRLNFDVDDWDLVKCIGVSFLNPLAGLITVIDNSDLLPWWAEILGSVITVSPALAVIGWGLGLDSEATKLAIEQAQEDAVKDRKPPIIRTTKSTFYSDQPRSIRTPITRDWLMLTGIGSVGNRVIFSGTFSGPDVNTLPRLVGILVDEFGNWSEKDKCSSLLEWQVTATLGLQLQDDGKPVWNPIIPVRYGIDLELVDGVPTPIGQVTWRILDDTNHVYTGFSGYTSWSGVPGTFEVRVTNPPEPFASSPTDFKLQLFTSCGVREFVVPRPPPVPKLTDKQKLAKQLERVANCYIFSTIFTRVKALQVFWLPTPQPGQAVAQHWHIIFDGLEAGRRIIAWDLAQKSRLAEVETLDGRTEISLIMEPDRTVQLLQLTLDHDGLLDPDEYSKLVGAIRPQQQQGEAPVIIQQTLLYPLGGVALFGSAKGLVDAPDERHFHTALERTRMSQTLFTGIKHAVAILPELAAIARPLPGDIRQTRGNSATEPVRIRPGGMRGPLSAPGLYFARPWHDRGFIAGRYFMRLSRTGAEIEIYVRGLTYATQPAIGRGNRDTSLTKSGGFSARPSRYGSRGAKKSKKKKQS